MTTPKLPGFEVYERLGSGFGGAVHRGIRVEDRAQVALKILETSREDPGYGEKLRRLAREGDIYASVRHPNLVPFLGSCLEATPPFLVFRYLPGGDLADRILEAGALVAKDLQRLGVRLAEALAALHAAEVLHRDVKAANVLLDAQGDAYLCDLGVGYMAHATRLTSSNVAFGTPLYMAPEVLVGRAASAQSDLFSLGVLLVFAATGELPQRDEEGLRSDWEGLLGPEFQPLLPLLRSCLRAHPEHRPRSARWVAEALRATALDADGPAEVREDAATQPLGPAGVAPSPQDTLAVAAELPAARLGGPPAQASESPAGAGAVRPPPAPGRALLGALLGLLAALACHGVARGWLRGAPPAHGAGLRPDGAPRRERPAGTEVTWELLGRRGAGAGLLLETPEGELEVLVLDSGRADAGLAAAWDEAGAVAEFGEPGARYLAALDPGGELLWAREVTGSWRLHSGWVSVRGGGETRWIERRTGRTLARR